MEIPFNKPYLSGNELAYINEAVKRGKISGNGYYTKKCQSFFEEKYRFHKCLLTTSCTDALEMAAILCNIQPGDEVIMPSYTFVSTANAFVLRGAKIIFADSRKDFPGIDEQLIENLITEKTKAIVVVHYGGIAVDMDPIMEIANRYQLLVVEDAAQSIDSYYNNQPLGGVGHLACFSFHETKNIQCGEGGLLIINDEQFSKRAEIIWEKGTNRADFFRGEVSSYQWVDIGSSFLPSEVTAAFLWAQIEKMGIIQNRRKQIWDYYDHSLKILSEQGFIMLPKLPNYAHNNAHSFYLRCRSLEERDSLIHHMKQSGVLAVFHYLGLHSSDFYKQKHDSGSLINCEEWAKRLIRLPLFFELDENELDIIISSVKSFYLNEKNN